MTTVWGDVVPLGPLTVLVGPNNGGKSLALREIATAAAGGGAQNRIVRLVDYVHFDVEQFVKRSLAVPHAEPFDLLEADGSFEVTRLESDLSQEQTVTLRLQPLGASITGGDEAQYLQTLYDTARSLARLTVAQADIEARLGVTSKSRLEGEALEYPALWHDLYLSRRDSDLLNAEFVTASGFGLVVDMSPAGRLEVRVVPGEKVGMRFLDGLPGDPRDRSAVLSRFQTIQEQGSGQRDTAAVAAVLAGLEHRVILLDEPGVFLHPTKARALGRWIARHTREERAQVIVSTHSAALFSGLLDEREDLTVYRVERVPREHVDLDPHPDVPDAEVDLTLFRETDRDVVGRLRSEPLLSTQRAHEALFTEGVVVVESEQDRLIYEAAARRWTDATLTFLVADNFQT